MTDRVHTAVYSLGERTRATGRLDPERRRLLAQTPLGQQVLREEGHDSQQVAAFAAPPAKPFDPELADLDRRLAALEQRSREGGLTPARRRQLLEASEVGRAVLKAETEAEWVKRAREEDERADRQSPLAANYRHPDGRRAALPGDRLGGGGCLRMSARGQKPGDLVLAVSLASGQTREQAAATAGVSPRTVTRRLADPEFCRLVDDLRGATIRAVADRLTAAALAAVNTLTRLLQARGEPVQLGAAKALIELAARTTETADLASRIAALEAAAQSAGPAGTRPRKVS